MTLGSVEEWFQQVPDLLCSKAWALACARPQAGLWHREHEAGRLVKIDLRLQLPPGAVLVGPEARQSYFWQHPEAGIESELELIAPGEGILRTSLVGWKSGRRAVLLSNALFGRLEDSVSLSYTQGTPIRFRASKDFPLPGDSGYAMTEAAGEKLQRMVWLRQDQDGKCRVLVAWQMPHRDFALWATFQFAQLIDSLKTSYQLFCSYLSSQEAKKLEKEFYVSLSITQLTGNPLIPSKSSDCTYVDVGESLGLCHWECFQGAFRLAEYLKEFLAKATGEGISAFQSKDGRQLAPHQCMVRRDQWCRVRGRFLEAFRVQRSAYRRCHGGSNAPAIYENKKLELLDARLRPQGRVRAPQRSMLVIRKTFWDVEEPARSMKRRRTVSFPLSQLMGK